MTRLDAVWDQLFPAEQTRIVRLLVEKVTVTAEDIEVRLRQTGIETLAFELRPAVLEEVAELIRAAWGEPKVSIHGGC